MILDLLADQLVAAGIGTLGTDLFINSMPAQCTEGVLLRATTDGIGIDWELPGMRTGAIAVIARSKKHAHAHALAVRAADALTVLSPKLVGETLLNYARPATEPVPYPESDGGYHECATRIDLCYVV